jgi:hypothetical protein
VYPAVATHAVTAVEPVKPPVAELSGQLREREKRGSGGEKGGGNKKQEQIEFT